MNIVKIVEDIKKVWGEKKYGPEKGTPFFVLIVSFEKDSEKYLCYETAILDKKGQRIRGEIYPIEDDRKQLLWTEIDFCRREQIEKRFYYHDEPTLRELKALYYTHRIYDCLFRYPPFEEKKLKKAKEFLLKTMKVLDPDNYLAGDLMSLLKNIQEKTREVCFEDINNEHTL